MLLVDLWFNTYPFLQGAHTFPQEGVQIAKTSPTYALHILLVSTCTQTVLWSSHWSIPTVSSGVPATIFVLTVVCFFNGWLLPFVYEVLKYCFRSTFPLIFFPTNPEDRTEGAPGEARIDPSGYTQGFRTTSRKIILYWTKVPSNWLQNGSSNLKVCKIMYLDVFYMDCSIVLWSCVASILWDV